MWHAILAKIFSTCFSLVKDINDLIKTKKNEKFSLSGDEFREGLTVVLSIKVQEPQFEGQTKTKLGNGEVKGLVDNVVYDGIQAFLLA